MKQPFIFLLYIFLLVDVFPAYSQIVSFNESTILLNKPNGKPAFQVNAGVEYWYHYPDYEDVWREIEIGCFVKRTAIHSNFLPITTVLYDFKKDSIGCILGKTSFSVDMFDADTSDFVVVGIRGYVEDEILQKEQSLSEMIIVKQGFSDSCESKIFDFKNTMGDPFTIIENCIIEFPIIRQGNSFVQLFVKEKTKILMPYGNADGNHTSMIVEITKDYSTDHPQRFVISNEAYMCKFDYNQILFSERNWSAGPDKHYQYSISSFELLMEFLGQNYKVCLPNSNVTGFLGYSPGYWGNEISVPGTLTFTDGMRVLLKKSVVCNDSEIAKKLIWTEPRIEFKAININDEVLFFDSTQFVLNSKVNCESNDCLTDFAIVIHLMEYDEDISIELEFRDGDIFLVKNYQDAFELR